MFNLNQDLIQYNAHGQERDRTKIKQKNPEELCVQHFKNQSAYHFSVSILFFFIEIKRMQPKKEIKWLFAAFGKNACTYEARSVCIINVW